MTNIFMVFRVYTLTFMVILFHFNDQKSLIHCSVNSVKLKSDSHVNVETLTEFAVCPMLTANFLFWRHSNSSLLSSFICHQLQPKLGLPETRENRRSIWYQKMKKHTNFKIVFPNEEKRKVNEIFFLQKEESAVVPKMNEQYLFVIFEPLSDMTSFLCDKHPATHIPIYGDYRGTFIDRVKDITQVKWNISIYLFL
ncbi:hypothetical protein GQR58_024911 [Nymphon striatum]|nr:hypothetical protein GQR58_024911 [Nymphon striatum]